MLLILQNNIDHKLIDISNAEEMEVIADKAGSSGGHTDVPILIDGDIVVFEA